MPPKEMVEVTLGLSDGTKIVRMDDLTTVQDFLEEHQEFVKVVRCRDCKHYDGRYCITASKAVPRHETFYCADGERNG